MNVHTYLVVYRKKCIVMESEIFLKSASIWVSGMYGSCHFNRLSNVEIGVKLWVFVYFSCFLSCKKERIAVQVLCRNNAIFSECPKIIWYFNTNFKIETCPNNMIHTSKLLFERRRLCFRLSVCLRLSVRKNGFGEQTSRVLEFNPEGLEG